MTIDISTTDTKTVYANAGSRYCWISFYTSNDDAVCFRSPNGNLTWLEDFAEAVQQAVASPGTTITIGEEQ